MNNVLCTCSYEAVIAFIATGARAIRSGIYANKYFKRIQ